MQKLNVIFTGNFSYPQGMAATKRIRHFAEYLAASRISVKILLLRQNGSYNSGAESKGVCNGVYYEAIGKNVKVGYGFFRLLIALPAYFLGGIVRLHGWKAKNGKNILFCYDGIGIENIIFVLVAKILGYHIIFDMVEDHVYTQENLHFLAKMKVYTYAMLENHIEKFANGIIVISNYLKSKYEKMVSADVPVRLIPISAVCSDDVNPRESGNPVKIVYTGSFAKKDSIEILIEAFANIRKTEKNCMLILAGKGANFSLLEDTISKTEGITYLGYLDDRQFYDLLKDADVLCATRTGSRYANAGFPFKLGEYLATGNPVVVSNVSDVAAYLEHMKDALIVEPDSAKEIQNALEFCIVHPEEARIIGENGKMKCKKYFDPQINGKYLFEMINGVK